MQLTRVLRSGKEYCPWLLGANALSACQSAGFSFADLMYEAVVKELADDSADSRPIDDAANYTAEDAIGDGNDAMDDDAMDDDADDDDAMDEDDDVDDGVDDAGDVAPSATPRASSPTPSLPASPFPSSAPSLPVNPIPIPSLPTNAPPTPTAPNATCQAGTAATAAPPAPAKSARKLWRQVKDRQRAREKKALQTKARSQAALISNRALAARHLAAAVEPQETGFTTANMPHVKTGYQGARDKGGVKRVYTLPELVGEGSKFGFDLRKWDGKAPIPILDELGRVFATCVGQPNDASWSSVSRDAAADIAIARCACKFPSGCRKHRRGDFPALAVGVSYGGGQKRPGNLVNSRANAHALRNLLRTRAIRRIAGFASGALAYWHPRLHAYYHDRLGRLFQHHPRLQRNFDNSVFACATVNFGPQTCCYPHTDANNLPFGLCAITALGDFNPELGGHLVLWDLKVVIEFPPGSTILLPSATVRHSNVAIQRNETRYSFTQYAAGGLFRWVDHGFQTEKVYQSGWSAAEKKEEATIGIRRWEEGNKLFSTLDELRAMDRSALPCDNVP